MVCSSAEKFSKLRELNGDNGISITTISNGVPFFYMNFLNSKQVILAGDVLNITCVHYDIVHKNHCHHLRYIRNNYSH